MKYAKYAKVFAIVWLAFTLVGFLFFLLLFGSAKTAWGAAATVGVVFGAIGAGIIFWADQKRREAGMLALAIEGARDDAWFGGRPVAVSVGESRFKVWRLRSDRSWEEDHARERSLGEGLKVTSLHVEGEHLDAGERLVFLPDGFGVSFRMAVEVRGIERAIEGDAAGAVRLAEAR